MTVEFDDLDLGGVVVSTMTALASGAKVTGLTNVVAVRADDRAVGATQAWSASWAVGDKAIKTGVEAVTRSSSSLTGPTRLDPSSVRSVR